MKAPGYFRDNRLYTLGLVLLAAGLPLSLFLTSVSQFVLAGAFLLDGGSVREKFLRFFRNKAAVALAGIWLLHVIGLAWTHDLAEGWKDVRIKLPLLVLPLIFSGQSPLSRKQFRLVADILLLSLLAGSLVSVAVLLGWIDRPVHTVRDIFIFGISHIRFSLFLCVGVYLLADRLLRKEPAGPIARLFEFLLAVWFIVFLVIIESITGLVILLLTASFFLLRALFQRGRSWTKALALIVLIAIPVLVVSTVRTAWQETSVRHPYPIRQWEKTQYGNLYTFDLEQPTYENGYPVNAYVCDIELREHWNKRSLHAFDSTDLRNQPLRWTLVRFLASKGWRKDGRAVDALSATEVASIEQGVANVNDQERSSLSGRIRQIVWEFERYQQGGNPSGHSVTQRLEFWKAAMGVIRSHPLFGTGTGDLKEAYQAEYKRMGTQLRPEFRLRAHNQYLAVTAALGIFGLAVFLACWIYPVFAFGKAKGLLVQAAWLITTISMLTEDTLETQAGATFAALFISLFLFAQPGNPAEERQEES